MIARIAPALPALERLRPIRIKLTALVCHEICFDGAKELNGQSVDGNVVALAEALAKTEYVDCRLQISISLDMGTKKIDRYWNGLKVSAVSYARDY